MGILTLVIFTRWFPLRNSRLAQLGDYTYTIYLFHAIFILSLVKIIKTHAPELAGWPIIFWIAIIFTTSVSTSYFVFNYIEKPMMKYSQQVFRNQKLAFEQTRPI